VAKVQYRFTGIDGLKPNVMGFLAISAQGKDLVSIHPEHLMPGPPEPQPYASPGYFNMEVDYITLLLLPSSPLPCQKSAIACRTHLA
jgi:hypothetical protein